MCPACLSFPCPNPSPQSLVSVVADLGGLGGPCRKPSRGLPFGLPSSPLLSLIRLFLHLEGLTSQHLHFISLSQSKTCLTPVNPKMPTLSRRPRGACHTPETSPVSLPTAVFISPLGPELGDRAKPPFPWYQRPSSGEELVAFQGGHPEGHESRSKEGHRTRVLCGSARAPSPLGSNWKHLALLWKERPTDPSCVVEEGDRIARTSWGKWEKREMYFYCSGFLQPLGPGDA